MFAVNWCSLTYAVGRLTSEIALETPKQRETENISSGRASGMYHGLSTSKVKLYVWQGRTCVPWPVNAWVVTVNDVVIQGAMYGRARET